MGMCACVCVSSKYQNLLELCLGFRGSVVCLMIVETGIFLAFVWPVGALHENMLFPDCHRENCV